VKSDLGHAVPAGLRALRDNDVRLGLHGLARLRQVLHLADQSRAGGVYLYGERARVAEREHDGCRLMGKHPAQHAGVLRKAPGDEAATDPGVTRPRPFLGDPAVVTIAAAEQTETTCLAHRRGKLTTRDDVHWSEQNRVLNSKRLREAVVEGHRCCSLGFVARCAINSKCRQPCRSIPIRQWCRALSENGSIPGQLIATNGINGLSVPEIAHLDTHDRAKIHAASTSPIARVTSTAMISVNLGSVSIVRQRTLKATVSVLAVVSAGASW
jgi:hypothetical protein